MKCKHRFQPRKIKKILNDGTGNGMIYVCTVQCVDCGKRTFIPRKYLKSPLSCYLEKYYDYARDIDTLISTKIYPYYSEEELRIMTNDDITGRITLLKKQKYKFGVDVDALDNEMQELKRELEKRANKRQ